MLEIEQVVIVGKFSDGKCRQILIQDETQRVVISAILSCEKVISVLDKVLDSIDIEVSQQPLNQNL